MSKKNPRYALWYRLQSGKELPTRHKADYLEELQKVAWMNALVSLHQEYIIYRGDGEVAWRSGA